MRILVVEDEKSLNKVISKRLEYSGYEVSSCYDGIEALECLEKEVFSGIVMDIMMPRLSGTGVLVEMNKRDIHTPVLFLTAKDSVEDRVLGLDLGAHDYLVKPFSFDELLARVRAMLRDSNSNNSSLSSSILKISDLELNKINHTVTRSGNPIVLSAKEFALLEYLMKHPNEVLSRERIESDVWETDYCGLTNVIDVYIRYLRKKIDDGYDKKLIQTVRGYGYMLEG